MSGSASVKKFRTLVWGQRCLDSISVPFANWAFRYAHCPQNEIGNCRFHCWDHKRCRHVSDASQILELGSAPEESLR